MKPLAENARIFIDASRNPARRVAESIPYVSTLRAIAARLGDLPPIPTERIVAAVVATIEAWRDRNYDRRHATIAALAAKSGLAHPTLDASLEALMRPFTREDIERLARSLPRVEKLIAFVMAGNIAGAGIHETVAAMLSGAPIMIKAATSEPHFFANLAATIGEMDRAVGERIAVMTWDRTRTDLTSALGTASHGIVAYGDDATIAAIAARTGRARLVEFGSRASAALICGGGTDSTRAVCSASASTVARDITLFEQRGCLSPHHVFVEDCGAGEARGYAARLARALAVIANEVPTPARPAPEAGAEIRGIRERARWRALAYPAETALWESDDLGWTVIYDRDADFRVSPGWRTVHVSAIGDAREFADRLGGLAGHIEAVALEADADRFAEIAERLMAIGVSRVCAPGTIQSPPVDWRHGGGAFFDLLEALR